MCWRYFGQIYWVKPFRDKKAKTVVHGFTEIVNESYLRPKSYGLIKEKNYAIVLCKKG